MRYKLLGGSGLRVSELCLGTMTFGDDWGWGASKETSRAVFDAYVAAGGNFIDTSVNYTNGTAETYVGEFLEGQRDRFVLTTKYSLSIRQGDPNAAGNSRKSMVQALEASLKRLRTDYIDVYFVHAWDSMTPTDEVMRALDDMVRAGKILYVGISDTPAWIVSRAQTMADLRGWTRFVALQVEYSLIERTPEREMIPMAQALDIAVLAWSPLAGGALSGKYRRDGQTQSDRLGEISERNLTIAEAVQAVAEESGQTSAQVAINWIRQQRGVFIPVFGARRVDQLQQNIDSLQHTLTPEQIARLNEVSQIDPGFPHSLLNSEGVRQALTSGQYDLIDNHRTH